MKSIDLKSIDLNSIVLSTGSHKEFEDGGVSPALISCPHCGSVDVRITSEPYDFGRCSETGYDDSGVSDHWCCEVCRASGDDVDGDVVMPVTKESVQRGGI